MRKDGMIEHRDKRPELYFIDENLDGHCTGLTIITMTTRFKLTLLFELDGYSQRHRIWKFVT